MVDDILDISLPTFDLNSYINNYKGYTRIERLIFISECCPILSVEALKLAIELSQAETLNTVLYEKLVKTLQEKDSSQCDIVLDTEWIQETKKKVKNTLQKMKSGLKNYKNNFIKESIRMGYRDLADYYYLCRDLENSLKFYFKVCEYCTTPKHSMDTLLNIIKIFLELKDFINVNTYLVKIQNMMCRNDIASKIEVISGLICLNLENYKEAALKFCKIKIKEDIEFNDIISVNDVVIYAVICALSSFSRSELKQYIIDNVEFWKLHELESQVFEVVIAFYSSNYLKCFDILNRFKNDFMLDIYLNRHVDNLFLYIRQKAYILYLKPFSYVDLRKMANVFLFLLNNMEKELIQLILESKISAKIDNINKFLIIVEPNQQDIIYEKILKISNEYKRSAKLSLLHMELVKKGLEIKTICDSNIDIDIENEE
ncbi:hypothetical protein T552_04129 [Pneumocystis carinii B80]|uniref:PCI domain-containing protein n=1 Tax=Pneumocystis carinii (strain B80) TaxID=1408658 RepID=A0A0W4ZJE6_PNEC8|nr:hypothetical protein T552_04129 [Pneumocystis carinii B80]KTW28498.1 hypothetical protein T552_04129 [Pneumocystis carinii B80]